MSRFFRFLVPPPPVHRFSWRSSSTYVEQMRFLDRLKQDDASCSAAFRTGSIVLFHRLSPLLQRAAGGALAPRRVSFTDLTDLDPNLLEESVLIGSHQNQNQNQAQFCLDLGVLDRSSLENQFGGTFQEMRRCYFLLEEETAPLVAKAQALLRWNQSFRFCSATGSVLQRNRAGNQKFCPTRTNFYYPTMSPVVLVLVSDGSRCLLGRQASFPRGLYSALAGFLDMGEELGEGLRREVAEEAGLEVLDFSFSSSHHWPFPHSSFMIGCHASVSPAHSELDVDLSELEDARWFQLHDIIVLLQAPPPRGKVPPPIWIPPSQALAHRLIREWAELQTGSKQLY